MSTAQSSQSGQQPGAGLTLNLASNNPFRNHTTSPISASLTGTPVTSTSPFDDPIPHQRPVSRNPFLDPFNPKPPEPLRSPGAMSTQSDKGPEPTAEELFDSLNLEEKKPEPRERSSAGPSSAGPNGPPRNRLMGPPRGGGPRGRGRGAMDHRPTRSQEEAMRARRMPGGPGNSRGGTPSSPQKPRARRNSDSSLLDVDKPLTEEEKKAREARRREKERRHRDGKDRQPRPNRKVDIIDQLDATSILGGVSFHHDGPFDACNPHRNRKGSRRAPINAFAADSLNNSMGGSGPLNAKADHSTFMGNADPDAFRDYNTGAATGRNQRLKNGYNFPNQSRGELPFFDPLSRGAVLHGDESMGLGTSTFLEGTPAAKSTIQKRQEEQAQEVADGGLQRKKSLAQRIRSINRGPREMGPSGRLTNPEGVYNSRRSPDPMPPATTIAAARAGERNPFFAEFGNEPETLSVKKPGEPQTPSSPKARGLERRATTDAMTSSPEDANGKPSLLSRVKSLKGSRKPRSPSGEESNIPSAPSMAA